MKKNIIIILIPFFFIVFALAVFLQKSTKENSSQIPIAKKEPEAVKEKPPTDKDTAKNYRESSEKYKYQIDVSYPAFINLAEKNILDSINSQIEKRINQEVDKYIAEARKNKIAAIFGYLTGNYTYSIENNDVLLVKMEMEKYLSGAAKSENYLLELRYNLKTGKQIN
ncbi:MAG TPA: hypothetical protein VK255_04625 [Patescibacteria group bacterium]|nr:hypothetical protein [Patescibacteria group bacterium]